MDFFSKPSYRCDYLWYGFSALSPNRLWSSLQKEEPFVARALAPGTAAGARLAAAGVL